MTSTPSSSSHYMRSPLVPSGGSKTFRRSPSFKALKEGKETTSLERRTTYQRTFAKRRSFVLSILLVLAGIGLLAGLAPRQLTRADEDKFLPDVPTTMYTNLKPAARDNTEKFNGGGSNQSISTESAENSSKPVVPVVEATKQEVSPGLLMTIERFLFPYRRFSDKASSIELPLFGSNKPPKKKRKKKAGPLAEIEPEDIGLIGRFTPEGKDTCHPKNAGIRLYMYDLDPEYNFGLLNRDYLTRWPRNVSDIPRYKGGMNLQHSPEYWLTVDLLTSSFKDRTWPCLAVRVFDPEDADLIYVPFFASLAYNKFTSELYKINASLPSELDRNVQLQRNLVAFLHRQALWNKTGGRDHVLVVHHPNCFHVVRAEVGPAVFVMADFGRYDAMVANAEKDVIAPYKHVVYPFEGDSHGYDARPTLLFFQGMIVRKQGGIIRQKLYDLIHEEEGVHFTTGNTRKEGIRSATEGMRASRFCLHLAGDTPSSNRLFDAIVSHCVPVVISDELELPFEDWLDYSEFCLFVREKDALIPGFLMALLRGMSKKEWARMWARLKQVERHFMYRYPSVYGDAVQMTWLALAKKVPEIHLYVNKGKRFRHQSEFKASFTAGSKGEEGEGAEKSVVRGKESEGRERKEGLKSRLEAKGKEQRQ